MPVLVALMAKICICFTWFKVVHAPNGNPAFAPDEIQATFLVRLGDYLNILRYNDLEAALALERQKVDLDHERLHFDWRERLISLYRQYNPSFPENFKIKCKTTKLNDPTTGASIEKPSPNSFLCMLDYFRNILVHLPLKDRLGGAKADRRKEVAISAAVDRFIATATTTTDAETSSEQQQMSRGKMVLFFKHAFPGFINVVVAVVKAQPNFAFSNNSVFVTSSKIRRID